jgi:hypothetical protein
MAGALGLQMGAFSERLSKLQTSDEIKDLVMETIEPTGSATSLTISSRRPMWITSVQNRLTEYRPIQTNGRAITSPAAT